MRSTLAYELTLLSPMIFVDWKLAFFYRSIIVISCSNRACFVAYSYSSRELKTLLLAFGEVNSSPFQGTYRLIVITFALFDIGVKLLRFLPTWP